MNSGTIHGLDMLLEVVKILGPALITGTLAYLLARAQYKNNLKQIDLSNELKARMILFEYYQDRIREAEKSFSDFSHDLSTIETTMIIEKDEQPGNYELGRELLAIINQYLFFLKMVLIETKREYQKLKDDCKEPILETKLAEIECTINNIDNLNGRKNSLYIIAQLRELHGIYSHCLHCQLEKYGTSVLEKYIQAKQ